jgi:hypothetical protein
MALFWQGIVNKLENQNNIEQKIILGFSVIKLSL